MKFRYLALVALAAAVIGCAGGGGNGGYPAPIFGPTPFKLPPKVSGGTKPTITLQFVSSSPEAWEINLSSSGPITLPSTVTLAAGQTSVSFTITVATTKTTESATIYAGIAGYATVSDTFPVSPG
jgi:hypothetical protein